LLEIALRGTIVYLSLFLVLRTAFKREAGALAMSDLLVIVLVADAAQNAMSADYTSITEGAVLVGTIVGWSMLLDWAGYHVGWIGRLVHPIPLELIRDGKLLRQNMKKELVTEEELMSQVRQQGVDDISEVKQAFMEGDGHVSVITRKPGEARRKPSQQEAL
jgi:uncharacterized membrane protein YcaP (DUF421 family)